MPRCATSLLVGPVNRFGGGARKAKLVGSERHRGGGVRRRPRLAKTLASNRGAQLPFVSGRNGPREGCVVPAPSSLGARHAVRDQEASLSPKPDTPCPAAHAHVPVV
ncbi:hypothetical protein HPB50_012861 [Hyalomma asiaticum]|uniref:Uncharacterized protein n=1 Tax=Hyalomma asiaticum TaxID=266040 RepID=A0ACB7TJ38_HYAAI|nr:hypothetical protein HPB50_012861 [Hyalomma asiaticum]